MAETATGSGTREDPWNLRTAPGTSEYQMWKDEAADPPTLVCQVGSTQLKYDLRAIDDLARDAQGPRRLDAARRRR